MIKAILVRFNTDIHGTKGRLICEEFDAKSLELPWNNNIRNYSCIPSGEYRCIPHLYKRRYQSFRLLKVKDRSHILIHHGNFASLAKGEITNVAGCILLGRKFASIYNQPAITSSRTTIKKFIEYVEWETFMLKIIDLTGMMSKE